MDVTAEDNCDDEVFVSLSEAVETLDDCNYQVIRTWTATDDAGNTTVASQNILVIDNTAPTITFLPPNQFFQSGDTLVVECTDSPVFFLNSVQVMDNCLDTAEVEFFIDLNISDCSINSYLETYTYTWIATDQCENTVTAFLVVRVVDTTSPIITCPADVTTNINSGINPSITGMPFPTDNCDTDIEISFDDIGVSLGSGEIITRTFIATDDCGNAASCSQTIIVENEVILISVQSQVTLSGAFDETTQLMRDDLRTLNLLPTTEPYTAIGFTSHNNNTNETVQPGVFAVEGTDAIVDWVWLELRDGDDMTQKLATRSALLQRDGDIVDMDGVSPVSFTNVNNDACFLVICHRNHLGIMTTIPLTTNANGIMQHDFTQANGYTGGYGFSQLEYSQNNYMMYAGDCNQIQDITTFDINALDNAKWLQENGYFYLYLDADLDLNGDVNALDKSIWLQNNGMFSAVPK